MAAKQTKKSGPAFRTLDRTGGAPPNAVTESGGNALYREGMGHLKAGRFADAERVFERMLQIWPQSADAHARLGQTLYNLYRDDEAVLHYREALALDPMNRIARSLLAQYLVWVDPDEAIALVSVPEAENIDGAVRQAVVMTAYRIQGRFAYQREQIKNAPSPDRVYIPLWSGCPPVPQPTDYQERGQSPFGWSATPSPVPEWHGEPLNGKSLVVYDCDGIGDVFHLVRYLPWLKSRAGAGRVVLAVRPSLAPFFAAQDPVILGADQIVPFAGYPVDAAGTDVFSPIVHLMALLSRDANDVPASIPYLSAPADRLDAAGAQFERAAPVKGNDLRVGFVWAAGAYSGSSQGRTCEAAHFAALAAVPGVRMVSLQKGATDVEEGYRDVPGAVSLSADIHDWSHTAALLHGLDLLVTVDTSVLHLAGAMGVPTWAVLTHRADWRWFREPTRTVWYPNMRLFRQPSRDNWPGVFQNVAGALSHLVQEQEAARACSGPPIIGG